MAKLTKRENFEKIMEVVKDYPELIEFCNHEIELLNKKNSRVNEKTLKENADIADMVKEQLEILGKPVTITELMQQSEIIKNYVCENGKPLSNQKLPSIMNKLVENKELAKTIDKRKSYFSII